MGVYDGHNGSQSAEQLAARLHEHVAAQPAMANILIAGSNHPQRSSSSEPNDPMANALKEAFRVRTLLALIRTINGEGRR